MRIAVPQTVDGSFHHRHGRVKVRVADAQQNDVLPPLLRLACEGVDLPGIGAIAEIRSTKLENFISQPFVATP